MDKKNLEEVIYKMIDLKLLEIKKEIKNIQYQDLCSYLNDVVFKNNLVKDINDASFNIMNLRINKLFEYMNIKEITKKNNTVLSDLKSILEG